MEAIQNIIIDDTLKKVGDAAFEPYLCHAYCHAGHCTITGTDLLIDGGVIAAIKTGAIRLT